MTPEADSEYYPPEMATRLRTTLDNLGSTFASAVVDAIRSASLDDILDLAGGRVPGRPTHGHILPRTSGTPAATRLPAKSGSKPTGRLRRRSPRDIAKALGRIVALVKTTKGGLRAEQIRQKLGMQAKEMPRILKEGLAKKVLRSKGQKRSTTYTAA